MSLEQTESIQNTYDYSAISIAETPEDEAIRDQAASFIGQVLVGHEAQSRPDFDETAFATKPIESLYEALSLAAEGDERARSLVEENVRSEAIEITIKAGHIREVDLHVNESDEIQQHGQALKSVQANGLRSASNKPKLLNRTKAESTNMFRLNEAYRKGQLEGNSFVTWSLAADDMSEKEMDGLFYSDTMSCSIQLTTMKSGRLVTEVAFVSGIKRPGSGSSNRHDLRTIVAVGERLGLDFRGKSAAEILAAPALISNEQLPNGAVDLVELWDDCAGGTYLGEAKPRQNYLEFREKCLRREATYEEKVQKAVNELIAKRHMVNSKVEAVKLLHDITDKHMVEKAIIDTSIDPKVFGKESASNIRAARHYLKEGKVIQAVIYTQMAIDTSMSFSCPLSQLYANSYESTESDQFGSLSFTCPNGHSNKRKAGELLDTCTDCGINVRC